MEPIPAVADTTVIDNLLRDIFSGGKVRMLGTIRKPLLVAKDVGDLLGIHNISGSIKHYNDDEKTKGKVFTSHGMRDMTLLTELGLYRLLRKTHKLGTGVFYEWSYKIVKESRVGPNHD